MLDDDVLVVDMTVHAYNHTEENYLNKPAEEINDFIFAAQQMMSPEGYALTADEYYANRTPEEMEQLLFHESDIDCAVYQEQALTDYYKDGFTSLEKGVSLKERNPDRVQLYGSVNPLADDATDQIRSMAADHDLKGLKLYPVRYEDGRNLKAALDDPDVGIPILETCKEVGIDIVAVHKALPLGRNAFRRYYNIDDVADAAAMFPDLKFEIVHAGWSFIEDTAFTLGRFPNLWANLEVTSGLIHNHPRRFAESLAELLLWGGPDKITFATGASFLHPQPLIEEFWDFQFPADIVEEYGVPQLNEEMKRKILGLNACELLDINPDALRESVRDDKWQRRKAEQGKPEPGSWVNV